MPSRPAMTLWRASRRGPAWSASTPSRSASGAISGSQSWTPVSASATAAAIRIVSKVGKLQGFVTSWSSFLRSPIWISSEGVAVFSVLRRPAGLLTRLRLSLPGVGGWRPGQDLAEGHLPQEALWRLQGVPGHRDGLHSSPEAVGQATQKGLKISEPGSVGVLLMIKRSGLKY